MRAREEWTPFRNPNSSYSHFFPAIDYLSTVVFPSCSSPSFYFCSPWSYEYPSTVVEGTDRRGCRPVPLRCDDEIVRARTPQQLCSSSWYHSLYTRYMSIRYQVQICSTSEPGNYERHLYVIIPPLDKLWTPYEITPTLFIIQQYARCNSSSRTRQCTAALHRRLLFNS